MFNQRIRFLDIIDLCDNTLFNGVVFPQNINSEFLIETIVDKVAFLEPVYPEYALFNRKIKSFFNRSNSNYQKIIDVLLIDYDPISNYDRKEILSTTTLNSEKTEKNNSLTSNSTDSLDSSTNSSTNSSTDSANQTANSRSSFDSGGLVDTDRVDSTGSDTGVESGKIDKIDKGVVDKNEVGVEKEGIEGQEDVKSENRISGNIGVTTSQQMIESEVKLRKLINVYELIAKDFMCNFMLRNGGGNRIDGNNEYY